MHFLSLAVPVAAKVSNDVSADDGLSLHTTAESQIVEIHRIILCSRAIPKPHLT